MKPRRKRDSGNLDSLLDTMTSVVGILVIMLIVIQLDVGSAVRRIIRERDANLPEITPHQLNQAVARLQRLEKERDELIRSAEELEKEMARQDELARLQQQIAALEKKLKQDQAKTDQANADSAALKKLKEDLAKLEQDIQLRETELKRLQALLATTRKPRVPPPKVVRMPDPKQAPAGARPVYFVARGERLYHVDLDELKDEVADGIRGAPTKKNAKGEYDAERIIEHFKRRPVGDRNWRVGVRERNYKLNFWIIPKSSGGEAAATIRTKFSNYQKILAKMDPKKQYLVFLVWPDSYELYLLAREVATAQGILAGWRPENRKETWAPHLGTYLCLDSHKAKKPPPSKPRDPRIPVDTID